MTKPTRNACAFPRPTSVALRTLFFRTYEWLFVFSGPAVSSEDKWVTIANRSECLLFLSLVQRRLLLIGIVTCYLSACASTTPQTSFVRGYGMYEKCSYTGYWRNGWPHGHGTLSCPDSREITFNGRVISRNGVVSGEWANGRFVQEDVPASKPSRTTENTNRSDGATVSQFCKENPWKCLAGVLLTAAAAGAALDKSFPSTPSESCTSWLLSQCVSDCKKVPLYRFPGSCESECETKLSCPH